jgi:hypothetical protein
MSTQGNGKPGRHSADPKILGVLLAGGTYKQAAKEAVVSVKTVQRRMGDPAFRAELDRRQAARLDEIAAGLSSLGTTALATVEELMGPENKPSVRLGAARASLDLILRYESRRQASVQGHEGPTQRTTGEPTREWSLAEARREALGIIDELEEKRTERERSALEAVGLPFPPSCHMTHQAETCAACRAWQDQADATARRCGLSPDGSLSTIGEVLHSYSRTEWSLRDDTHQLLERASRAQLSDGTPEAMDSP